MLHLACRSATASLHDSDGLPCGKAISHLSSRWHSIIWPTRIRNSPQRAADLTIGLPLPRNADHTFAIRPAKDRDANFMVWLCVAECHCELSSSGTLYQTRDLSEDIDDGERSSGASVVEMDLSIVASSTSCQQIGLPRRESNGFDGGSMI